MKNKLTYLFFMLLLGMSSCRTYRELKHLSKCDFELESIQNTALAGVNFSEIKSSISLNFNDLNKVKKAFGEDEMLLSFTAVIKTKNPNNRTAAINKIDYIIYLEDIEMARGSVTKRVEIPASTVTFIPIEVETNLKKVFKKESMLSIVNFAMNLNNKGTAPSNMKFQIKPTLMMGKHEINYGKYVTVKTQISSDNY
jgi:LEA14-like dessication related protein